MARPTIIAVDGPAASGKGTLARRLAAHFDFAYLDTGLLYRAVGLAVLADLDTENLEQIAVKAAKALDPATLDNPALRSEEASAAASKVAAIGAVRDALIAFQRGFATSPPGGKSGAVLDGRDIGTVICPDADIKIFVDADIEVRAERRVKELQSRGLTAIHARVLQDMKERDARDRSRRVAPLAPADDAIVINTTSYDADKAFSVVLDHINLQNKPDA